VLVKRGPHKGQPAFQKEPYMDGGGKPRWRARVYDPSEGKYLTATFRERGRKSNPEPGTAWAWVREKEGRRAQRQSLRGDRRTVAEYIGWWLDMKAKGAVHGRRGKQLKAPRARTMTDYGKMIRRWITEPPEGMPPLGRVRLDQLAHGHLDDFYHAMLGQTTPGIVRRFHALLSQAFAEAWRKGLLPVNPCDRASVPGAGEREGTEDEDAASSRSLTEEHAGRFLKAARELERDGPYSALLHVLTLAGLRPSEAFALDWDDVLDLDGQQPKVRVRRSLSSKRRTKEQREQNEAAGWRFESPKTKNGRREVPLPGLAAQELRAWRLRQKWQRRVAGDEWTEHGLCFTTSRGTPLGRGKGLRRAFVRVMAHANGEEGVDGDLGRWGPEPVREHLTGPLPARRFSPAFRVYDLRHTCVSLWLRAGVPAHVASKLAGHATTAFTLTVYAKALPSQKQEAADAMDRMFGT
jgi:integrase